MASTRLSLPGRWRRYPQAGDRRMYDGRGRRTLGPMDQQAFLDASAPVPVDVPFTRQQAVAEGVPDKLLARWLREGFLCSPLHGVYYASQLADDLDLRIACVRLVAPESAVVT